MNNRKLRALRVVFGFCGGLQEDIERFQGVAQSLAARDWQLLPVHEQFERTLLRLAQAEAVDGVIGDFISEAWLRNLPAGLPVVHLGRDPLSAAVSSVTLDARRLGEQAARHLGARGYAAWVWVEPPGRPRQSEVLQGMGRVAEGKTVLEVRGLGGLRELLPRLREGTGFFCESDFLARQVMGVLLQEGWRIPEDAGVLGTGDRLWDRITAEREISSLIIPHGLLGAQAAGLLAERFAGRAARSVRLPPGEVIPRESTLRPQTQGVLAARLEGWLRGRLADPPSMADLARQAGMSRSLFERQVRAEVGETPYQFLLTLRLQESQRLLRHSDWTVARIGEAVGYAEPAQFSLFFRQRSGTSPSAWRRKGGAGPRMDTD